MESTVTPSKAAPPFSDLKDFVSIPFSRRYREFVWWSKGLDSDDRIDVVFDGNDSINVEKVI